MITNDRQYKIFRSQINKFQESLSGLQNIQSEEIHPAMIQLQKAAIESKLREMAGQVKEYEELKAGHIVFTEVSELAQLPVALIKSRIANGLTQAGLAQRLGMKEQQIQKLEAERYESASLKTMLRIADDLKIKVDADVQIKDVVSADQFALKNYPFKQMFQRKWFSEFVGTLNEAGIQSANLIENLFARAGVNGFEKALTRRTIRADKEFNEYALNAWYAKVIIEARKQELNVFFDKAFVTELWLQQLAQLSVQPDGPKKAFERLNEIGIRTVIEPQIDGTYLDGAALLLDNLYPIIAMTLRHDRLDNFWFVLFHEIAHIYLHLDADHSEIFDDLDVAKEGFEKEADEFALNALIQSEVWRKSLARFSPSNVTIINQAKKMNVHPALIAGRIRRETGKYFEFNDLVGHGEVRKLFADELNNQ